MYFFQITSLLIYLSIQSLKSLDIFLFSLFHFVLFFLRSNINEKLQSTQKFYLIISSYNQACFYDIIIGFETGNKLVLECMGECRVLIKEAMKVVCDLHSHDDDYLSTQDHLFNVLLRPRLPYEVNNSLNQHKYNRSV